VGHEGHESHEQHAFTSPYPRGVAGLVKNRTVSGCARTPLFSTITVDVEESCISFLEYSSTHLRKSIAIVSATVTLTYDR
jgi:hypothetical protein